jgi:hypothetical protein
MADGEKRGVIGLQKAEVRTPGEVPDVFAPLPE